MRLTIVDVFAEKPLAGNQLAVVQDAAHLSDEQMQSIAREMNYSETTFVLAEDAGRAKVRIFTPEWELPFAGHPTLGTAWVLSGGQGEYVLDLPVGDVPVRFDGERGSFTPPPVDLKDTFDRAKAAALIGLSSADLDPDFPVRFAECGPQFVLIPVARLEKLKAAKLNEADYLAYRAAGLGVQCVFIFSTDSYGPDADFASRMYFHSGNLREDPATGSANSAFAAYLRAERGHLGPVVVDQGVEMLRPSRLYLEVGAELAVGGKVFATVRGELLV